MLLDQAENWFLLGLKFGALINLERVWFSDAFRWRFLRCLEDAARVLKKSQTSVENKPARTVMEPHQSSPVDRRGRRLNSRLQLFAARGARRDNLAEAFRAA
jgi:hypothetical protein